MKKLFTDEVFVAAGSREKLPCECEYCGGTFYTSKNLISQELKLQRGRVRFCNQECHTENQKKRHSVELNCTECNMPFLRQLGDLRGNTNTFCSRRCYGTFSGKIQTQAQSRSQRRKHARTKELNGIVIPMSNHPGNAQRRRTLYEQIGYDEAKSCQDQFMFLFWGLYWGEGSKRTKSSVSIANMDPLVIKNFIKGMTTFYGVLKNDFTVRITWHTHCDFTYNDIIAYWVSTLNLKQSQLRTGTNKTTYYPNTKIQSHYGVCNIRICSTEILHRIMGAIKYMREVSDSTDLYQGEKNSDGLQLVQ